MQGIGMLTKPHYIKEYTMQGHPVQGLTVQEKRGTSLSQNIIQMRKNSWFLTWMACLFFSIQTWYVKN